jgi:hypothetical protein
LTTSGPSRRTSWSLNSRRSCSNYRTLPSLPSAPLSSLDLPMHLSLHVHLHHLRHYLRLRLFHHTHPPIIGHTALSIDHGPFPTAYTYSLACAERASSAQSDQTLAETTTTTRQRSESYVWGLITFPFDVLKTRMTLSLSPFLGVLILVQVPQHCSVCHP